MAFPDPVLQVNSNTWDAELYKEAFDMRFEKEFTSKMAISMITTFKPGNYNTRIVIPTLDIKGDVTKDEVSCERGELASTDAGFEEFLRKDRYYKTYKYCPANVMRTDIGVAAYVAEADRQIKRDVMYRMDQDAVDIAIANAGAVIPAVTDAATAQAALDAVTASYSAYSDQLDITAIIPSTMLPFFRELGVTRITNLGDMFFKSGQLFDIFGVKLRVVDAARLTDPTKVLFVIGKPVCFYYEKMSMGINEYSATPNVADGKYVDENLIREVLVEGDFHVWSQDQKQITVAG